MSERIIYFDFEKVLSNSDTDVKLLYNANAVRAWIINIITTEPYTRIYKNREYGCNLKRFLFEPVDTHTAVDILEEVERSIDKFCPLAKNVVVEITPMIEEQTFQIDVACEVDQSETPINVSKTLQQLR